MNTTTPRLSVADAATADAAAVAAVAAALPSPAADVNGADVWRVILTRVTDCPDAVVGTTENMYGAARFDSTVRRVLTAFALTARVRPGDVAAKVTDCLPDVRQETVARSPEVIRKYVTDAVAYVLPGAPGTDDAPTVRVNGRPIVGVVRARSRACRDCDGCDARKRCLSPEVEYESVTFPRVVSRVMRAVAREVFVADRTYASTLTDAQWSTVADTAPTAPTDTTTYVMTAEVRAFVRAAADAATAAGAPIVARNGKPSVDAGNALALLAGQPTTERGRRAARAMVRAAARV